MLEVITYFSEDCLKIGRLKKLLVSVWELMCRKGSGADSTTHGVLIIRVEEAIGRVHQMDNHGCELSPHVYNLLINGFVLSFQTRGGNSLFQGNGIQRLFPHSCLL
ncbi:hypothetical protein OIU74_029451 [Salix koriyanagi]|uniref:Uncharacterized protein n=1 Tax=Salix koriyanagi TaxID=2511006 RepID=A0A9Q0VE06_9ROSI|nr:hypothetical protein OIU74_029451 [Salix koriyanagi]